MDRRLALRVVHFVLDFEACYLCEPTCAAEQLYEFSKLRALLCSGGRACGTELLAADP